MDEHYIGIMSGTSLNGADAVLVSFNADRISLISHHAEPFPAELYNSLQDIITRRQVGLAQLADLDQQLAIVYTLAVKKLLQQANIPAGNIHAIGCHGQTIHHQPDGKYRNSVQIGDPNFISEHTGISVVADFRRRDMAAGGQGAPLVPAFHNAMFRSTAAGRVIVNIGGIANITVLDANPDSEVLGFDTGPGNTLMDLWIQQKRQETHDHNGAWAASGEVDTALLTALLDDEYFARAIPKSSGREYFNLAWLQARARLDVLRAEDVQATLLELSCTSIAQAIARYAPTAREIYVCGGGAHNARVMQRLEEQLAPRSVQTTAPLGLAPDKVEATAFAWLARQTLHGKPGNLTAVTGARHPVILGAIYQH